ncbi:MAG: DsbA family protein [Rhizobiaceae bacterium]|nr:DsbA family protein [Rhizobiaceae bacterium]
MIRRSLLRFGVTAILIASGGPAFAAPATTELMKEGALPEKSFGSADAPVTVIEYASLTCPHCRSFHLNTWPTVKEQYIDTGKVRFIMREFPLDVRASGGFMLARCSGEDKWYAVVDLLYRTQDKWARVQEATIALKSIMGMTGMSGEEVEACLKDQTLLEKINAVRDAGQAFGVESTPTFFINGELTKGALTVEQFRAIVDPFLKAE